MSLHQSRYELHVQPIQKSVLTCEERGHRRLLFLLPLFNCTKPLQAECATAQSYALKRAKKEAQYTLSWKRQLVSDHLRRRQSDVARPAANADSTPNQPPCLEQQ
jgi:hypothetical protein